MLPTFTTSRSSGSFVEVAWKNGIVIVERNLPSGPSQVDDQPVAPDSDAADVGGRGLR